VLDLEVELGRIVDALNGAAIGYALWGGIAMAVHGSPRATIDIDLLVLPDDYERIADLAAPLGYRVKGRPMTFANGAVEIRRITKVDPDGDTLMLDLCSSLRTRGLPGNHGRPCRGAGAPCPSSRAKVSSL
jgi:hypothetical protein